MNWLDVPCKKGCEETKEYFLEVVPHYLTTGASQYPVYLHLPDFIDEHLHL